MKERLLFRCYGRQPNENGNNWIDAIDVRVTERKLNEYNYNIWLRTIERYCWIRLAAQCATEYS